MQELKELHRQGMSIQAISKLTGWDRKDSQVHAGGGVGTGIWSTLSTAEQARCIQAVSP